MMAGVWVKTWPSTSSAGTSPCGFSALKGPAEVLLRAQIHGEVVVRDALQIEGDPQPMRGTAAEEVVQLHRAHAAPPSISSRCACSASKMGASPKRNRSSAVSATRWPRSSPTKVRRTDHRAPPANCARRPSPCRRRRRPGTRGTHLALGQAAAPARSRCTSARIVGSTSRPLDGLVKRTAA
ncbi:hypothetical protein Ddc_24937 [Ditylenchus destructor]|nr:hypothetical protein Ddc_24937 [Ditylenchus destructor]